MSEYQYDSNTETVCPFCNQGNIRMVDIPSPHGTVYAMECVICGARGPIKTQGGMVDSYSPETARDYWKAQRSLELLKESEEEANEEMQEHIQTLEEAVQSISDFETHDDSIAPDLLRFAEQLPERKDSLEDEVYELKFLLRSEKATRNEQREGVVSNLKDVLHELTNMYPAKKG